MRSDDCRSFSSERFYQSSLDIEFQLSRIYPPADLMVATTPPELPVLSPFLGRISKVPTASTFSFLFCELHNLEPHYAFSTTLFLLSLFFSNP
jgi:hypothetical protein